MIGRAGLLPIPRVRTWGRDIAEGFADRPAILPFALGAVAWLVILATSIPATSWRICTSSPGVSTTPSFFARAVGSEIVMLVAMMAPLVAAPVEHIVARSYQARQFRGAAVFLLGYLGVWLAISIAITPLSLLIPAGGERTERIAASLGLLIAAMWQMSPTKALALRRCSRTAPIRQDGWRADLACARYGADAARDCVTACWALMLSPLIAPNGLACMVLVQSIAVTERYKPRPDFPATACGLIIWSGVTLLT